jgi:hypothetical protein
MLCFFASIYIPEQEAVFPKAKFIAASWSIISWDAFSALTEKFFR